MQRSDEDNGVTAAAATLEQIQELFREAVSEDPAIALLQGFKVDFSGNRDFHKVYLALRCQCGTAGLLSVEVDRAKTLQQVREAMPSLLENLQVKARMFTQMSCEMHTRMRQGNL